MKIIKNFHPTSMDRSISRRTYLQASALGLLVEIMPSMSFAQSAHKPGGSTPAGSPVLPDTDLPEGSFYILDPVIPTQTGGKIEVIEFFWYGCPHCNVLEPLLEAWTKKLGGDVSIRYVPVYFQEGAWKDHARLYYALEALGVEKQLRRKVFDALHVEQAKLETNAQIVTWAGKNGIEAKKITEALSSFGVTSQVSRAGQLTTQYGLEGVPMLAVNGKFLTSPAMAKGNDAVLKVLDVLIYRERRARRSTLPSTESGQVGKTGSADKSKQK